MDKYSIVRMLTLSHNINKIANVSILLHSIQLNYIHLIINNVQAHDNEKSYRSIQPYYETHLPRHGPIQNLATAWCAPMHCWHQCG